MYFMYWLKYTIILCTIKSTDNVLEKQIQLLTTIAEYSRNNQCGSQGNMCLFYFLKPLNMDRLML